MSETTYHINDIITTTRDPKACAGCGESDYIEEGIVKDDHSKGKTYVCTRCEALTIVTDKDPNKAALLAEPGKKVQVRLGGKRLRK